MIITYDATLVILSILVAIIGSYTGLLIMAWRGPFTRASYKLKIVAGAVTIGASIWSMHFIAMLALGLPIPMEYDSLVTVISAFVAILLTGLGLYSASSGHIARYAVPVGGLMMGSGIAGMHYMGMSAIRANCILSYQPYGVAASVLVGVAASTLALWFTFRERSAWETALGAVALGFAISSMHYVAMIATSFTPAGDIVIIEGAMLTQQNLAFIVATSAFVICGMFLVMALPDQKLDTVTVPVPASIALAVKESVGDSTSQPVFPQIRVPVHRNQSIYFAEPETILAVRADGHYSWISLKSSGGQIEEFFCERSISTLAKVLDAPQFVRAHRSHLVNIRHVLGFRRQGDGGLLFLDPQGEVSVPVSRSNLRQVLTLLTSGFSDEPALPQPATA
jgi:NO-binding membrane sensor protein with MHYT domain